MDNFKGTQNFKIGDKIFSLKILDYESSKGIVEFLFVNGSPITDCEILYKINERGIQFSREKKSLRGHSYTEILQKVISPKFRGEKKDDLVWMIESNLFKKDYEVFYLPLKIIN